MNEKKNRLSPTEFKYTSSKVAKYQIESVKMLFILYNKHDCNFKLSTLTALWSTNDFIPTLSSSLFIWIWSVARCHVHSVFWVHVFSLVGGIIYLHSHYMQTTQGFTCNRDPYFYASSIVWWATRFSWAFTPTQTIWTSWREKPTQKKANQTPPV